MFVPICLKINFYAFIVSVTYILCLYREIDTYVTELKEEEMAILGKVQENK